MTDRAFVSFNLNESARVKPTKAGLAELERQTLDLNEVITSNGGKGLPIGPYVDADGYYQTSLWSIMSRFGHMLEMGATELPFEDNKIEIELRPE